MSSAIFLLKGQFTGWPKNKGGAPRVSTFKKGNYIISPNSPAKLLTKLALSDLVVLIAALAIGILGVLGMTHVMNMPSEMIYAFAGVALVAIPYAILLIKNITKRGLDEDLVWLLKKIPITIGWACSKSSKE